LSKWVTEKPGSKSPRSARGIRFASGQLPAAPVVMLSSTRVGSSPEALARAIDSHTESMVEAIAT
jgi:hypothetical protein